MKLKGQEGKERGRCVRLRLLHCRPGPTGNFLPSLTFLQTTTNYQEKSFNLNSIRRPNNTKDTNFEIFKVTSFFVALPLLP